MPTQTYHFVLPFRTSANGSEPLSDHLIGCETDAEAVSRAEQMASYPEYAGAVAFKSRKRDGVRYGRPTLLASFGVFSTDLSSILKSW